MFVQKTRYPSCAFIAKFLVHLVAADRIGIADHQQKGVVHPIGLRPGIAQFPVRFARKIVSAGIEVNVSRALGVVLVDIVETAAQRLGRRGVLSYGRTLLDEFLRGSGLDHLRGFKVARFQLCFTRDRPVARRYGFDRDRQPVEQIVRCQPVQREAEKASTRADLGAIAQHDRR